MNPAICSRPSPLVSSAYPQVPSELLLPCFQFRIRYFRPSVPTFACLARAVSSTHNTSQQSGSSRVKVPYFERPSYKKKVVWPWSCLAALDSPFGVGRGTPPPDRFAFRVLRGCPPQGGATGGDVQVPGRCSCIQSQVPEGRQLGFAGPRVDVCWQCQVQDKGS